MSSHRRLRLAVPNKGRLQQPALDLLRDAGLIFERTERALSIPVRNVELDLLFVRTEDVPEMVADGVAEMGITGIDLVSEADLPVTVKSNLGFGHCRLVAAVTEDDPAQSIDDFRGRRVATAHPRTTETYFAAKDIDITIVPLRGSVEVAPRLGLADAIVDLVSSGSTMLTNGLRPIVTLLESQAVLVAGEHAEDGRNGDVVQVTTMLQAVVAARRKRYVLMNAPATAVADIEGIIPGLDSPTVVPLAHEGMVAVHSVVDAAELWNVLPRLEAAGASGILVLPIEQLIP